MTIPAVLAGLPASQRDGRLRAAISSLIGLARQRGCRAIVIEDLDFAAAREQGRERHGNRPSRGARGRPAGPARPTGSRTRGARPRRPPGHARPTRQPKTVRGRLASQDHLLLVQQERLTKQAHFAIRLGAVPTEECPDTTARGAR